MFLPVVDHESGRDMPDDVDLLQDVPGFATQRSFHGTVHGAAGGESADDNHFHFADVVLHGIYGLLGAPVLRVFPTLYSMLYTLLHFKHNVI